MGFNCGIVGLPNVGKSTLFNALTKAGIDAANYPFCTIDPNVGKVPVPDERLQKLAQIVNPEKIIPTTMEFVDIAGLVAGASKGEGLGNKFLANIRETDAILHVVRCFEDDDITHVAGKIDPVSDVEVINTELLLADIETVSKAIQRVQKFAKSGDKEKIKQLEVLQQLQEHLDNGNNARSFNQEKLAEKFIKELFLLTVKPVLYVANIDDKSQPDNPYVTKLAEIAKQDNAKVLTICANIESEIVDFSEEEKKEFLASINQTMSGLDRIIKAGHDLLGLQCYFTAGKKEVRAWTIAKSALAPQAAAAIHTDFERGFIRAEVIAYDDYINYKGEQGAKEAGKLRLEGKAYPVKDGDVIHFLFNV